MSNLSLTWLDVDLVDDFVLDLGINVKFKLDVD